MCNFNYYNSIHTNYIINNFSHVSVFLLHSKRIIKKTFPIKIKEVGMSKPKKHANKVIGGTQN